MDRDSAELAAQRLLSTFNNYSGGPTDVNHILEVAINSSTDDPRLSSRGIWFQALSLLKVMGLVDRPDGFNIQISSRGRTFVQSAWHADWTDPELTRWLDLEDLGDKFAARTPIDANTFQSLRVDSWRQFRDVEISFDARLTILTGANAAGKTTLLNILAPHFSWNAQLISRKSRDPINMGSVPTEKGELRYTSGVRTPLLQQEVQSTGSYPLTLPHQQPVPGIFISSHRSISAYQPLQAIPPKFSESNILLQQFASEVQTRYSGGQSQFPPLYRMKESLVAAAFHAYGNIAVVPNDEAREVWEGFQDIIRYLLPTTLNFRGLVVDAGDVFVKTATEDFPLEAASGGLSAMLELAWQIFLRGRENPSFTVCIDEPENHLHPELQRSILPTLLEAFPSTNFIIATHSPFVVTATRDCAVYALRPNRYKQVSSRRITDVNASGTSDQTLMSVLGLDTALPLWAESALQEALRGLSSSPSAEELRALRKHLRVLGLDQQFPAAVNSLKSENDLD